MEYLLLLLTRVWLFWRHHENSLPASSVQGMSQAGILEGVAISSSRGSSWPRGWTYIRLANSLPLSYLASLYWGVPINSVVIVSGEQRRDSATHIHVSILPQQSCSFLIFPSGHEKGLSFVVTTISSERIFHTHTHIQKTISKLIQWVFIEKLLCARYYSRH